MDIVIEMSETEQQLRKLLNLTQPVNDTALTKRELCQLLGYGERKVGNILQLLIDKGYMQCERRYRPYCDGSLNKKAVYFFTDKVHAIISEIT